MANPKSWRKGISPLIASVLLMAFTLSVAVLFSPWATNMLDSIQSETSDDTERLVTASNMGIELVSASFNRSSRNLSLVVRNSGNEEFSNFSVTVMGDKPYNKEFSRSLGSQEIVTVDMYAGDPFDMDSVSASLTNYPVSTERGIDGVPAEDHLIGYWPLDSGSGVYANGSIDSNDGVLRNGSEECFNKLCPTWEEGVFGNSVDFDGENDFVCVSSFPYERDAITVSFYVNRSGVGGVNPRVIDTSGIEILEDNGYQGGDNSMSVRLKDPSGSWHAYDYPNSIGGNWEFYAVSYNGEKLALFRGSELIKQEKVSIDLHDFYALKISQGGADPWNGSVDEVKVWKSSLPNDRIKDPVLLTN